MKEEAPYYRNFCTIRDKRVSRPRFGASGCMEFWPIAAPAARKAGCRKYILSIYIFARCFIISSDNS